MHLRGQKRRRHPARASTRLNKREFVKPTDLPAYSQALIKMDEVGTAAKQHMLAVVHHLARARMLIRRRSAAHIGPPLKKRNAQPCIGERAARRQPGQSAADDCDGLLCSISAHAMRSRNPRESILSFSQVVKRTRSVSTS